uniref:Sulfotransferase n=1 Tax=Cyclopterus lumpus TaxID=8103 RepID=A0A8C2WID0_CYCLU
MIDIFYKVQIHISGHFCCPIHSSGTTWTQEIVPLIVSGGDPASVEILPSWERVPWLEETQASALNLNLNLNMMPPSFFEVNPRVINVMRNPKDVFTSAFYYYGMAAHMVNPGQQSEFLHTFLEGKVVYGSWFDHVKSWLNAEDQGNVMHISYEEMILGFCRNQNKQTMQGGLCFSAVQDLKITDRCLFKNMKRNKMSNYLTFLDKIMDQTKSEFLRKYWKNLLTPAEAEYFDTVYKDKLKDVKYTFVWKYN